MITRSEKKSLPRLSQPNWSSLSKSIRKGLGNNIIPLLNLLAGLASVVMGSLLLVNNGLDKLAIPLLACVCVSLQLLFMDIYRQKKIWDLKVGLLSLLALIFLLGFYFMPEYVTGWQINGVIHRSFFGVFFLIGTGIPTMMEAIFYAKGASPKAEDLSRYPLVLFPVMLAIAVYLALIFNLLANGLPNLKWDVISHSYYNYNYAAMITIAGDWPKVSSVQIVGYGIENQILGTCFLMLMTIMIAFPFGVGAGIFLNEYSSGWLANFIRTIITSLRSISLLILGFTALSLVNYSSGTPLAAIFKGYQFNGFSWHENQGGTFFTASLVLSLLVIPIIARATEEGCHSLPDELREGSVALGATDETTLFRVVLPWSLPNIVTAIFLGCAEAAGDMAVLMFIAGRGDFGIGPFKQVTSLSYLIFDIWWGEPSFKQIMLPYQYTAGVILLIITVGLGVIALVLKRWLVKNHRGG